MGMTIHGTPATAASDTRYATVAQLKARLGISDVTDDTVLGQVLDGACRAIDQVCGERFYTTAAAETRYFTATTSEVVRPGPLVSITTLTTDDSEDRTYATSWTANTDYELEPANAVVDSVPYRAIRTTPVGSKSFPTTRRAIKIVGKFGWSAVPDNIREAALLASERLWKRKDAILGVVGSFEMGELKQIVQSDPEIKTLLTGMVRHVGLV
jgi:hypothetical protein